MEEVITRLVELAFRGTWDPYTAPWDPYTATYPCGALNNFHINQWAYIHVTLHLCSDALCHCTTCYSDVEIT